MSPMLNFLHVALDYKSLGLSPTLFTIDPFQLLGFEIGPLALRWYSLSYIAGILVAWWLLGKMAKASQSPYTKPQIDDFITWATLGIILGGRTAYVLFYNPSQYLADPLAVFRLWDGGMSFHGGVIGVVLAVFLTARAQKINGLRLLDYVATVTPVGMFFGRLANFVNGELWGRTTNARWGIIFPGAGPEPRHPSQLYEAGLEGLLLFVILYTLFWRTDARLHPGRLAGCFGVGMALFRMFVEQFREPDAQLGILSTGLTMGQTLSLPLLLCGAYLLATSGRRTVAAAR
jgi:phosphatidylglycerol:prolipoprotein diacylglycerol transferase